MHPYDNDNMIKGKSSKQREIYRERERERDRARGDGEGGRDRGKREGEVEAHDIQTYISCVTGFFSPSNITQTLTLSFVVVFVVVVVVFTSIGFSMIKRQT